MPSTAADPVLLGGPGLRTFLNIAAAWGLSDLEQAQLLGQNVATLEDWQRRALAHEAVSLDQETLERLGAILGIYRSLLQLLPSDETRARWLRAPNDAEVFGARSALHQMTETDLGGLLKVLQYLRAQVVG